MFARSLHVTTPLNEFVCTIIDREPIFHWGRTHRSGERFSRRKSGQFVALPLVGGLHYRYDGRLKEPNPSCTCQPPGHLQFASEPSLVPARTSAHRLKHRRMLVKLSRLRCIRGYNIPPGTEFSRGTISGVTRRVFCAPNGRKP